MRTYIVAALLAVAAFASPAQAASRYWVGGGSSANWNATGPTNWGSASNTRDGVAVPTSADDVFFDGVGFGANDSTLSASITIKSLNMTGYANTLTQSASTTLTIAGSGVTFVMSGIYSRNLGSSIVSFTGTSGVTTITTNGVVMGPMTFNGAGGTWRLQDSLSSGLLTILAGTFDANSKDMTIGGISSTGSTTRALSNLPATITLNVSGAGSYNVTLSGTGLTIGSPSLAFTDTGATTKSLNGNSFPLNDIVVYGSGTFQNTSGGFICNNLDLSNFTGTWANSGSGVTINGSLTLSSGLTSSFASGITFAATTTGKTITSAGKTVQSAVTFNGVGGGWTLSDALTCASAIILTNGSLDTNGKSVQSTTLSSSNSNTRSLSLGSTSWTLSGTGTVWDFGTTTGLTFSAGTSLLVVGNGAATAKTFAGGGQTYSSIVVGAGGTSPVTISGSNTIRTLALAAPKTITLVAGSTQTLSSMLVQSEAGNLLTINSDTPGSQATLSAPQGTTIVLDYLSLQDVAATGGASWLAGSHSTSVSGNSGWSFAPLGLTGTLK